MTFFDLNGTANQAIAWTDRYIPEMANIRDTYATPSELGASVDFQLDQSRSGTIAYAGAFNIGQDGTANSGKVTDIRIKTDDNYLSIYIENIILTIDQLMALEDNAEAARQWEVDLLSGDDALSGSKDGGSVKARMMSGNDFAEIFSGNENFVNGNQGNDQIFLSGGKGLYLGGSDHDRIKVDWAEAGTQVNGNAGRDFITGNVDGVTYRGGADNDILAVSAGIIWGDKGSDTFQAITGEGVAIVQDYTAGEDLLKGITEGSFTLTEQGLAYGVGGDQMLMLAGITDASQVTLI